MPLNLKVKRNPFKGLSTGSKAIKELTKRSGESICTEGESDHSVQNVTVTRKTRAAVARCGCRDVCLEISVPHTDYNNKEQESFVCHCKSCMRFVDALHESLQRKEHATFRNVVDRSTNSIHYVNFDDSHIRFKRGAELLAFHRIRESSETIRMYATCCRSPIGYCRLGSSTITLCGSMLRPKVKPSSNEVFFVPPTQYGIHRTNAPVESASHEGDIPMYPNSKPNRTKQPGLMTMFKSKPDKNKQRRNVPVPEEDRIRSGYTLLRRRC